MKWASEQLKGQGELTYFFIKKAVVAEKTNV